METIDINVGKYKFKIIDNTLLSRDQIIYSRNFKIGGNISDCVNISIRYIQGKPVSAYIPLWELRSPMTPPSIENGKGIISMVKTLLNYVNIKIPTITEVSFEDKSNIECATDNTKKVTNICPIPLYYFSIAFNGETWYEKHFNARQKDINKHTKYKEKINKLLYFEEEKSNTTFLQFLEIAQPPKHLYDELEKYYNISKTFGVFFTSIPKIDRCRVVRDWISNFMEYYLKDVFSNADWVIEIPSSSRGGKKNTRKYYCPNGRILNNKTYKDFGITMLDV